MGSSWSCGRRKRNWGKLGDLPCLITDPRVLWTFSAGRREGGRRTDLGVMEESGGCTVLRTIEPAEGKGVKGSQSLKGMKEELEKTEGQGRRGGGGGGGGGQGGGCDE
ncbi:hypothetical protein Pmani_031303 [Petrolisthes manimaculis]|uniref:Uncharacterized protein n=1 Tax=Petrolisthes manimaculis TaxID=1843537 RepID=A0AAE1NTZ5_9EUCA|nr:hypothetical protein Pmani_031303 [Petrolisthes manimaculis]